MTDPTTRLLRERVRRLYRHLPGALAGEAEPLHQMRLAARRLRLAVTVLARKPHGKRARRVRRLLRELARTGGHSRDLDVVVALLEDRLLQTPTAELKVLVQDLHRERGRSRHRLGGELLDLDIARLRRDLEAILTRRCESIFGVLGRIPEAAAAERARLMDALEGVGDAFDPSRLHAVRVRFRRLRYTAELLDELQGRTSGAPEMFRSVQEVIGSLRDAFLLSEWLERKGARAAAAGREDLARCARRERDLALERARSHHRALLLQGPRDVLGRGLEAMTPSRGAA